MKRFLRSVEGLVLAVLLVSGATLPASAKDVKIGLLMPFSGRYAEAGIGMRRGIEMILNDVNAAGGIKSIGGAAGFTDDKLWNALTDEVASKTLSRSFGLAFYSEDATLPGMKSALARGRAAYPNVQMDPGFLFGVQAAKLLVMALENARSDEPGAVNDAFRSLRIPKGSPEIVLPIISGDFSFDKRGSSQGTSPVFVQWAAGRKAIVYPDNVASLKKLLIKGVK